MRDIVLSSVGGAVIYVALAACSGQGNGTATRTTSGGPAGMGGSSTRDAMDSGLVDALLDPVPKAAADPMSGTRLRARYRLGDDGSKEYLPGSWFDSQRNETCTFVAAADGQQRCLPDGITVVAFSDSGCTKPIVMAPTSCSAPAYALTLDDATCSGALPSTHVLALGAATMPSGLYLKNGTTCFSAGPVVTGYDYYDIGAEVPATSFVSANTLHD
jgi:hypothetical protein